MTYSEHELEFTFAKKQTAYLQRVFMPVFRYVKVIKIHQDFPELRLQMYCHFLWFTVYSEAEGPCTQWLQIMVTTDGNIAQWPYTNRPETFCSILR